MNVDAKPRLCFDSMLLRPGPRFTPKSLVGSLGSSSLFYSIIKKQECRNSCFLNHHLNRKATVLAYGYQLHRAARGREVSLNTFGLTPVGGNLECSLLCL